MQLQLLSGSAIRTLVTSANNSIYFDSAKYAIRPICKNGPFVILCVFLRQNLRYFLYLITASVGSFHIIVRFIINIKNISIKKNPKGFRAGCRVMIFFVRILGFILNFSRPAPIPVMDYVCLRT